MIAGSLGLLLTLLVNVGLAFYLAFQSTSPEVPANFDQRFLVLETWGRLVPFVWGFSAKWLPVFLGLRPVRGRILLPAIALNSGGVLLALAAAILPATVLILTGLVTAITALRLFEPSERPAKVKGVHVSFPFFVRLAYIWALIAAFLSLWAALSRDSSGIGGASRHALTVGFLAMMVFAIGQRVLPAFSGMRLLVQHQTDVLLSLAACSRLSLASQFRGIGLSKYGSRCLVMASDVRDLRDGRRHRLCIQSPHYVCTPDSRRHSAISPRSRVIYAWTERVVSDVREQIEVLIVFVLAALSCAQLFL